MTIREIPELTLEAKNKGLKNIEKEGKGICEKEQPRIK